MPTGEIYSNYIPTITTPVSTVSSATSNPWALLNEIDKLYDKLTVNMTKKTEKKKKTYKLPEIKQIYFNEKTGHTTIVWADGSESTVVHCLEGEKFERYMGFCAAIVKKLFGSTSAAKNLMEEKDAEAAKIRKREERLKAAEEHRQMEARNRERKEKRRNAKIEKIMKAFDSIGGGLESDHD